MYGGENMLIDSNKLGEMLGVSRSTIFLLRKKGLPYKKIGSQIRFEYEEVMIWINEQKK